MTAATWLLPCPSSRPSYSAIRRTTLSQFNPVSTDENAGAKCFKRVLEHWTFIVSAILCSKRDDLRTLFAHDFSRDN